MDNILETLDRSTDKVNAVYLDWDFMEKHKDEISDPLLENVKFIVLPEDDLGKGMIPITQDVIESYLRKKFEGAVKWNTSSFMHGLTEGECTKSLVEHIVKQIPPCCFPYISYDVRSHAGETYRVHLINLDKDDMETYVNRVGSIVVRRIK